jgi:hypothetical protein
MANLGGVADRSAAVFLNDQAHREIAVFDKSWSGTPDEALRCSRLPVNCV